MEIVKLEKCTTLYKLGVNINYIYTSVLILKSDSKICLILLALIILVSFSLYIMVVVTVPYYVDGWVPPRSTVGEQQLWLNMYL